MVVFLPLVFSVFGLVLLDVARASANKGETRNKSLVASNENTFLKEPVEAQRQTGVGDTQATDVNGAFVPNPKASLARRILAKRAVGTSKMPTTTRRPTTSLRSTVTSRATSPPARTTPPGITTKMSSASIVSTRVTALPLSSTVASRSSLIPAATTPRPAATTAKQSSVTQSSTKSQAIALSSPQSATSLVASASRQETLAASLSTETVTTTVLPTVDISLDEIIDGYNAKGLCQGSGPSLPIIKVSFNCSVCTLKVIGTYSNDIVPGVTAIADATAVFLLENTYLWNGVNLTCTATSPINGHNVSSSVLVVVPQPIISSEIPSQVDTGTTFTITCIARNVYAARVAVLDRFGNVVLSCDVGKKSATVDASGPFRQPYMDSDLSLPSCASIGSRPATVRTSFYVRAALEAAQDGYYKCSFDYWNGTFISSATENSRGSPLVVAVPPYDFNLSVQPSILYDGSEASIHCTAKAKPSPKLTFSIANVNDLYYSSLIYQNESARDLSDGLSLANAYLFFTASAAWNGTVVVCTAGSRLTTSVTLSVAMTQRSIDMPEYVYLGELFAIQCHSSGTVLKQVAVLSEDNRTMLRCTIDDRNASVAAFYDFKSALLAEPSKASCSAAFGLMETSVAFFLSLDQTSTLQDRFYRCAFTSSKDYRMSQMQLLLVYVAPTVVVAINDVRDGYNVFGYCSGLGKPPPSFNVTFSCSSCPLINSKSGSPLIRVPDTANFGSNVQWFFLEAPYLWVSSFVTCTVNNHPRHEKSAMTRIAIQQPYLVSQIPRTVDVGKVFTMTCIAQYVYVTKVEILNENGTPVLSCHVNGNSSNVSGKGGFQPPVLDVDRTMPSCLAASERYSQVKVTFFLVASLAASQDGRYTCAINYWNGSFISTMTDDSQGYQLVITVPPYGLVIYPAPAAFYVGTSALLVCVVYAKPPTALTIELSSPTNQTYHISLRSDPASGSSPFAPLGATYVNLTFVMTQKWDGAVANCYPGALTGASPMIGVMLTAKNIAAVAGAVEGVTSNSLTLQPTLYLIVVAFAFAGGWLALDKKHANTRDNC